MNEGTFQSEIYNKRGESVDKDSDIQSDSSKYAEKLAENGRLV